MAFTLLPNEIFDRIIADVIPEGFESLILTCKQFHALCTPFVSRYNTLRAQFRHFTYYDKNNETSFNIRTAFDLIAQIAVHPIIARYILNADFSVDSRFMRGRPRDFNPDVRPKNFNLNVQPDSCSEKILDLLASSPYLKAAGLDPADYWAVIDKDLENRGYSQHASAFLLTLLPNANTLSLPRKWKPLSTTDKLVNTILSNARQSQSPADKPSVAQATRFQTSHSFGPRERMDLAIATPFLALPSLRYFYGPSCVAMTPSSLTDDHSSLSRQPYHPTFISETLQAVHIRAGCIDAVGIAAFLAHTPRLRSLRYSHCTKEATDESWDVCTTEATDGDWDICALITAISHAVGPHLEELSVSVCELRGSITPGHTSLRGFQQLRKLEFPLEVALLCNTTYTNTSVAGSMKGLKLDEAEAPNLLADLVPASVIHLALSSSGADDHAPALEAMFRDIGAKKEDVVPKLEEMYLSRPNSPASGGEYKEVCDRVKEECEKVGVVCHLSASQRPIKRVWDGEEWASSFIAG